MREEGDRREEDGMVEEREREVLAAIPPSAMQAVSAAVHQAKAVFRRTSDRRVLERASRWLRTRLSKLVLHVVEELTEKLLCVLNSNNITIAKEARDNRTLDSAAERCSMRATKNMSQNAIYLLLVVLEPWHELPQCSKQCVWRYDGPLAGPNYTEKLVKFIA